MSPRLLVLTAGFGEGHNAAARAVAEAWEQRHGPGSAVVADAFALAAPRLNQVSRKAYLGLINRAPGLWSAFYGWLDRSPSFPRLARLLRGERQVLARLLRDEAPDVICSTYPVYSFLLGQLDRPAGLRPPHYLVVTDSISINSLWWRGGADGWFVPNADSAAVLLGAGLDPAGVEVTGFPVAPVFARLAEEAPADLALGAAPRVLYLVNSRTSEAIETARRLLTDSEWDVTCTVGHHHALKRELEALAARRRAPTRILGWTKEIPSLLVSHHVVVSKAGGATTQEAIAARCPMVVNQIIPGQEEGNYELLRRHGAGAFAPTADAVLAALRGAFADGGRGWRAWREALGPLSRPSAAADIAARLERVAQPRVCPVAAATPVLEPA